MTAPERDYQKDWEFLTQLLWGHIHEWEKKARQSEDNGDHDMAFGRKACAEDLRFSMRLWGPPEPENTAIDNCWDRRTPGKICDYHRGRLYAARDCWNMRDEHGE